MDIAKFDTRQSGIPSRKLSGSAALKRVLNV
jgi:hypothetical protein